eukprot:12811341-Heterocapsa_arctica.AAC.1
MPTARYRKGDWKCPQCGFSNHANKKKCFGLRGQCNCPGIYGLHAFGDDTQTKGGKQITLTARPEGGGANRREINAMFNA